MIQFLHHYWAYLVLFMFALTVFGSLGAFLSGKKFNFNSDFRLALFTLISFVIQVILGFFAYFTSDHFQGILQGHMGEYMKSAPDRLIVVEHPTMMLIALWFTYYGFKRMSRNIENRKKFLDLIIFYGIAFILILIRIPWSKFL